MATVTQPAQGSDIQGGQPLISKHVFATGVHKPEFSQYLTYCYPQYTLTSLLVKSISVRLRLMSSLKRIPVL